MSDTMSIVVGVIILIGITTIIVTKNNKPRVSQFSFTLVGVMLLFFGSLYFESIGTIILIILGALIAFLFKDMNPAFSNIILVIVGLSVFISITMLAVKLIS